MRILLTGGSACGKSTYAEQLSANLPEPRYYIATMKPYDRECLAKIVKHRAQRRDLGFVTFEQYTDLASLQIPERGTLLLECMCNWLANEMFTVTGERRNPLPAIRAGLDALEAQAETLIVVTNEVGGDAMGFDPDTQAYVRLLGELNRELAERYEVVAELVCGIVLPIKGVLPTVVAMTGTSEQPKTLRKGVAR